MINPVVAMLQAVPDPERVYRKHKEVFVMAEKLFALYLFVGSIAVIAEMCYVYYDVTRGEWARTQRKLAAERAWQARRLENIPTPEYLARVHAQAEEGRKLVAAYYANHSA